MIERIVPNIRTQLSQAVNRDGLMAASYHLDRLRAEIDVAKCHKEHGGRHLVRHSLIRKVTAQRYRELRQTWCTLTA